MQYTCTSDHKYPPPIVLYDLFLSNLIHVLVEIFDLHIHLNIDPNISYILLKYYLGELKIIVKGYVNIYIQQIHY